ncbi:MAG: hypothetical protein LQ341_001930 [Variospora aurantia]|nr:MAG: hypothetical protein LQ341_001930 [Variospora aurantia]
MRGGLHDTFLEVTVHTAKCDSCNQNNKSVMYRCTKCGRQQCSPCWSKKGGDGRHVLHDKDHLTYQGPKAEDLPPKEKSKAKATETERAPSTPPSTRKRRRESQSPTQAPARVGAYAPTASPSTSTTQSENKRRRQVQAEYDTEEEEAYYTEKYGPVVFPDKSNPSSAQPEPPKPTSNEARQAVRPPSAASTGAAANLHQYEYPLESAVNSLIHEAAASDTEDETSNDTSSSSKDHEGMNIILKAATMLERESSSSSSPVDRPGLAAAARRNRDLTTPPPRNRKWTPVNNSSYTFPAHRFKAHKETEYDSSLRGDFLYPHPPAALAAYKSTYGGNIRPHERKRKNTDTVAATSSHAQKVPFLNGLSETEL